MKHLVLWEWLIILLALASLWPVVLRYDALWYKIYLVIIMLALLVVTRNRFLRTRDAAAEAQRKHDEMTRRGTKPLP